MTHEDHLKAHQAAIKSSPSLMKHFTLFQNHINQAASDVLKVLFDIEAKERETDFYRQLGDL